MENEQRRSAILEAVSIPGVTTTRRGAVFGLGRRAPVLLVHGIFDNLRRWITAAECSALALELPDYTKPVPLFARPAGGDFAWPPLFETSGLLARLAREGFSVLAFSYQDAFTPCLPMTHAVEALHRAAAWALERTGGESIDLVGFSRGGLICRQALHIDSPAMNSLEFRRRTRRLVSICSPFAGTSLARVLGRMEESLVKAESAVGSLGSFARGRAAPSLADLAAFRAMFASLASLTPDSQEIRLSAAAAMPPLADGSFAIAGSRADYFSCRLPILGEFRLPPRLEIDELIDGKGDVAVAVESALDIPGRSVDRTCVLPANHFTAAYDAAVHDQVVRWLTRP